MPLVGTLPFFITQQKASSEPHFWQTCTTLSVACLPRPSVLMTVSQPGQRCFAVTFWSLIWPLMVSTEVTVTVLHLGQDMASMSPDSKPCKSLTVVTALNSVSFCAPFFSKGL